VIGSLRGTVLDRSAIGEALVEVQGVGYRVTVAPGTLSGLGDVGAPVFLWVHHHVRDDAVTLYGFTARAERDCFEALIGAHGVGPALALAILSVHTPSTLGRCLLDGDLDALTLVPGVGKKTAARLLVELKSRLDLPERGQCRAAPVAVRRRGRGDAARRPQAPRSSPMSEDRSAAEDRSSHVAERCSVRGTRTVNR